ncbi:hypothetical protein C8T65DRAFT_297453 [Cerioporus squamosus]|nr:hypothetical protein C8T65DRAFT_297453 [Cerioporus squamosus]
MSPTTTSTRCYSLLCYILLTALWTHMLLQWSSYSWSYATGRSKERVYVTVRVWDGTGLGHSPRRSFSEHLQRNV